MRNLWQRWRDPLDLHARLAARRSKARPEFVRGLAAELSGSRRPARAPLRLALAGALTLMLLVAAGTVGGVGYAASAAKGVANAVTGGPGGNGNVAAARENDDDDDDDDADDDQYAEERRQCRRAVEEAHRQFHAQQRKPPGHDAYHRAMREALRACEQIGGGGGGDDD